MFAEPGPRLFALPPGVDFGAEVVRGLECRLAGAAPAEWAAVTLLVNTRRMQRRIRAAFDSGPARVLPRIRLITDLGRDADGPPGPPPASPLRRRLHLAQLVLRLIDLRPEIAPRSAAFDLADSLARLFDEMQGEGVSPATVAALDVSDQSGHWARSLAFIGLVEDWIAAQGGAPDAEARQRLRVEALAARWATDPPPGPIVVAGSTGSRGSTAILLSAVARLPQGAVILPGFDFDLPESVWDRLDDPDTGETHPQFRFRRLMADLGLRPGEVQRWTDAAPPHPARNRLMSLSLRPAPVTDAWRAEGPALGDLGAATAGITLLEAPSPRIEAEAIALRLRHAHDEGITAALVTPDRMLTRQVAAALDRWAIRADDSAGVPLPLTPPGRFLRQAARLRAGPVTGEALLALLKHPLCHSGGARGPHLLGTEALELWLRRDGPAFPDPGSIAAWGAGTPHAPWAAWLAGTLARAGPAGEAPLAAHVAAHLALAEAFAAGIAQAGSAALWDKAAGQAARSLLSDLEREADAGGRLDAATYAQLFDSVLAGAEVREAHAVHPRILIWGTLEARVQSADLVILAGLNEGVWPATPAADPWLNRVLRRRAGLLLPERQVGLAAHDYMQAAAAREVWISRSRRSAEAETVPSRWVNRLVNLLEGLPAQGGAEALRAMRARGEGWVAAARALSAPAAPVPPAPRPSPRPPPAARPRSLSVTRIETLLRDPYAIYAECILRLPVLPPLRPTADALLRGEVSHRVFETFLKRGVDPSDPAAPAAFLATAREVIDTTCPWPLARRLWLARLARIADRFIADERARQAVATPAFLETAGRAEVAQTGFTLTAQADRIDIGPDGRAFIYDYKTGRPPSRRQQMHLDKQLLLEAAMLAQGGFAGPGPREVAGAAYIGVGLSPEVVPAPLDEVTPAAVWADLGRLVALWQRQERGYTARRAVARADAVGPYDHLARHGEWDMTAAPEPEDLA